MSVLPPRPKGPPITSLRAFEAAARLGGFTRAADELCVTPGAVAQQVKALEAWCGVDLFERHAQGVRLSRVGVEVLPSLSAAFDAMGEAVSVLRRATAPGRVHISALPAVAQLWLSPRLPAIRAALADVEISVTALEAPPNLAREPFDLSVFYGEGDGRLIARDEIFPVCAPEVARQLQSIEDLANVPCLADAVWTQDWETWLSGCATQVPLPAPVRGPVYSLYALAVEEAVNGAGVLIGHSALVARHLESGALVAPFSRRVTLPRGLVLGVRGGEMSPPLTALVNLLISESRL
ncbi:LysR family transcriptional regulator [Shimia abyssi]|nr:LysR family transcriptional regulator [Shimia abyssi]